jgi:tetratricopeptide (TPR) repeat protein
MLLLAGLVFAGCGSAGKSLERGIEAENEGQYAEAARHYISALRRDRNLEAARERLVDTGNRAVSQYLRDAERDGDAGRHIEAGDAYVAIDRLVADAADVGIDLDLPSGYESDRETAMEAALAQMMDLAIDAENAGRFDAALEEYDRIEDRFEPDARQAEVIRRSRYRVLIKWGEAELAEGRFRSALDKAEHALDVIGGPEADGADAALRLQVEAIDLGTLYVAIVPLWKTDDVGEDLPVAILDDLNDLLQLDYWSAPPPFIALADPALVRRTARRLDYNRSVLSRRDAADLARELSADIIVFGEVDEFSTYESDIKEKVRSVKTKDGVDTTFVEVSGRIRYELELSYRIVSDRGDLIDDGEVEDRESGKFKRGEYDGDYRDLDLSRSQRKLFDIERYIDVERDVEEDLLTRIAKRYSKHVFDRLTREVG